MGKSYEIISRVGISTVSLSDAIQSVVMEANKEKRVSWFEVVEQRGRITSEDKVEYQVTVKIGRRVSD